MNGGRPDTRSTPGSNDSSAGPQVLTVTQVNQRARQHLERQFARITIVGEVSNIRVVGGHHYFSLKDDRSQLSAVLFRREAGRLKSILRDGTEVIGSGRLTIYAPRGTYQIVLDHLEPRGTGDLQAAFEELKKRLAAEGLFDKARKRPLPMVPRRVAVVTSPTGAVIRDIINTATRRFSGAHILVVPTRVQGARAGDMIAAAVARVSRLARPMTLDVMIVARGGGSLEDLWPFNEEKVARAIVASPIPVVCGVGHETDSTIADFVADLRASTPSAAAELVFPQRSELSALLRDWSERNAKVVIRDIRAHRHRLMAAQAALGDGRALVAVQTQRLTHAQSAIHRAMHRLLARHRATLNTAETRLIGLHPRAHLRDVRGRIHRAYDRVHLLAHQIVQRKRDRLAALQASLEALSPLGVLERGYSIVLGPDGAVVRAESQVASGDRIDIRLARGRLGATVE